MPLLATARTHFTDDIQRARNLARHADPLPPAIVRDDILRAAWMMGVGAADAYFCDAYADLAARTLQSRQVQSTFQISDRMLNLKVPAIAVISNAASDNWRWRMAARQMIEEENVLSIDKIKKLFNQFYRDGHKPFSSTNFDLWIVHTNAKSRLFGVTPTAYRKLIGQAKNQQRDKSVRHFENRMEIIFQRRHDCIHNCDRPKVAINTDNLNLDYINKVLDDICFLVDRFEESILAEFPEWLQSLGATAVTRNRVLQ